MPSGGKVTSRKTPGPQHWLAARDDRFAGQEPTQIIGQRLGRRIAMACLFLQAGHHDGL